MIAKVMGITKEEAMASPCDDVFPQTEAESVLELLNGTMPQIVRKLRKEFRIYGDVVVIPWSVLNVFGSAKFQPDEILDELRLRLPGWEISPHPEYDSIFIF